MVLVVVAVIVTAISTYYGTTSTASTIENSNTQVQKTIDDSATT